jgi:mono/diheme cytochrome c family protein
LELPLCIQASITAADENHWDVTAQLLQTARIRSVERHTRDNEAPDLDDSELALKGVGQYAEMCVMCHLAPGMKETALRQGLYPLPPDLTQLKIDPKAAFWVIKHGIKMSGMPAWAPTYDDDTLWSIVAFLSKLPALSPQQYKNMVEKAPPGEDMAAGAAHNERGTGHHGHTHSRKKAHHK